MLMLASVGNAPVVSGQERFRIRLHPVPPGTSSSALEIESDPFHYYMIWKTEDFPSAPWEIQGMVLGAAGTRTFYVLAKGRRGFFRVQRYDVNGSPDTDGDRIEDYDELQGGTDPLRADTDSDGVDDYVEVTIASDPRDESEPAIYWVSAASGSDANPGTALRPYATIRRAVSTIATPTVIHVWGGVYSEPLHITNSQIAIVGLDDDQEAVVIGANAPGSPLSQSVRFADVDGDQSWSAAEPVWIDSGNAEGVFDAGDDALLDDRSVLQEDVTHGMELANARFSDRNSDGAWDREESVWVDSGSVADVYDAEDEIVWETPAAVFDGARDVYLDNLTWKGVGRGLEIRNGSSIVGSSLVMDAGSIASLHVASAKWVVDGIRFKSARGVSWRGDAEVVLLGMRDE